MVLEVFVRVILTVIAIAVVGLAWRIWTLVGVRRYHNTLLRSFPCAPDRHWLYGHAKFDTGKEDAAQMTEALTSTQKLSRWYVQSSIALSVLNLVHPDTFKTISRTAEPKCMLFYGGLKEWLGEGLLIRSGKKWKTMRRLLTPAFHFGTLKPYVQVYNDCTLVMLDKLKDLSNDGPVEIFEQISLLTLDILLRSLFKMESNCQLESDHNEYVIGVRNFALLTKKRMNDWKAFAFGRLYYNYLTVDGYRSRKNLNTLHEYSRKLIKHKKELRENGQTEQTGGKDFLDILLDAQADGTYGITDEDIQSEVDTFLFEGHDTTASGISWFLYNLARHPEHQEKCRQEIDDIMKSTGKETLDWGDVHNMPYITMCLKESLRTHPPVYRTTRQLTSSHQFPDGNVAHPGTIICLPINNLHHNPHVWESPDVYDPTRFTVENCKGRPSHAFVPFSAGPRNCIGQNFAMDEMKVVTALVLRHFELSVDGCPEPKRRMGIVLRADNGILVTLKERSVQEA